MKKKSLKTTVRIISVLLSVLLCLEPMTVGAYGLTVNESGNIPPVDEIEEFLSLFSAYSGSHTWDAGRAGTVSLDNYTLLPSLDFSAISVSHNVYPVDIRLSYNPDALIILDELCDIAPVCYGTGFLPSDFSFITEVNYTDASGLVLYRNGNISAYLQDDDISSEEAAEHPGMTKWSPIADYSDIRVWKYNNDNNGIRYVIENYTETEYYDALGRLVKIENNESGASKEYSFDPVVFEKINTVTDGIGNEYRFSYVNGTLSKIKVYNSQGVAVIAGDGSFAAPLEINLSYTNGNLTQVTFQDGISVYFSYCADGLASVETADGHRLEMCYAYGRVSRVTRKVYYSVLQDYIQGDYVDITGNSDMHTFTDCYGNTENVGFDEKGNISFITDGDGNYLFGAPETDDGGNGDDGFAQAPLDEDPDTDTPEDDGGDDDMDPECFCPCSDCFEPDCPCTPARTRKTAPVFRAKETA